jgi:hypothetical protein
MGQIGAVTEGLKSDRVHRNLAGSFVTMEEILSVLQTGA